MISKKAISSSLIYVIILKLYLLKLIKKAIVFVEWNRLVSNLESNIIIFIKRTQNNYINESKYEYNIRIS